MSNTIHERAGRPARSLRNVPDVDEMRLAAFTSHKDPSAPLANDDRIVAYGGRLFAVIDGVTAKKGPPLADGSSRGQAAGVLIERALRELIDDGSAMTATTDEVLRQVQHHFEAEYARLDMHDDTEDPHLRFGAQLAAALYDGMTWRVLVVGDCGARLNGTEVIATPNRGDGVLALLRSEVFTAARERLGGSVMNGTSSAVTDRALEVARAYTVSGSGSYLASFEDALPLEAYRESSEAAESRALSRFPDLPTELVRDTLAHGLLGIGKHRNKPGPLGTPCIDGTPVPPEQAHDRRIGKDALVTLELFSDGYFGCPPPGEVTLAAWEAHIARVESVDPFKIGDYPSTKGSSSGRYTDDRTVLIVTPEPRTSVKEAP